MFGSFIQIWANSMWFVRLSIWRKKNCGKWITKKKKRFSKTEFAWVWMHWQIRIVDGLIWNNEPFTLSILCSVK